MTPYLLPGLMIAGGLVVLVLGAEVLVRGAAALAAALRISSLVIGLTVVAFGTSAPELAVSVLSAMSGKSDLAVGNVVGSNIFNVLVILGLSAVVTPLVVAAQIVRLDVPLVVGASVLLLVLGWDGRLGQLEGGLLFAGLLAYVAWSIVQSRRESAPIEAEFADLVPPATRATPWGVARDIGYVGLGLVLLVLGSHGLVGGAVEIAGLLGISELLVGLTIVAGGTSLPELATSVVAALKGERDIAVGNVVGSNLFNLLGVLGLTALVTPAGVPVPATALALDIPVMIVVAVACLPVFFTGHRIVRWEGALFLAYYAAYIAYLAMLATRDQRTDVFETAMLVFVLPLTAVTLLVGVFRAVREQRGAARRATPSGR